MENNSGKVRRPINERTVIYVYIVFAILIIPAVIDEWISMMFWFVAFSIPIYILITDFKIYYDYQKIEIKYFFRKKIYTYNQIQDSFFQDSTRLQGRIEFVVLFEDGNKIKIMDNYENFIEFISMIPQNTRKY